MLWVKALHIIFMVCWFAGLFYLPRLFVYHQSASDPTSLKRFQVMERKLYYVIMAPSALFTILFGAWLMYLQGWSLVQANWLSVKLLLVFLLVLYHLGCGRLMKQFAQQRNLHGSRFYRIFNELPVFFLFAIVILVVVKPF